MIITLFLISTIIGCLQDTVYGAFSPILSSTAQTETTVTLSWTQSNDWVFSNYNVTYSNSPTGPFYQYAIITDKGITSTAVTNLNPNSDYYFIVYDSGALVDTSPSNTLYKKTMPIPTLSIVSKTASTVSLQWSDSNTYSSKIPFHSYVVQMSTNGGEWSTLTTLTDVTLHTYTVTGLSPATYEFRMYDKVGSSGEYSTMSNKETATLYLPIQVNVPVPSVTTVEVGQQVQLTAYATGGSGFYIYQWYVDGNPTSTMSSSFLFTPTETGSYNIQCTVKDAKDDSIAMGTSNNIPLTVPNTIHVTLVTPTPIATQTTQPTAEPIVTQFGSSLIIFVVVIIALVIIIALIAIKRASSKKR